MINIIYNSMREEWLMASVDKRDSKLPYNIWIDSMESYQTNGCIDSPCIYVEIPWMSEKVPITISIIPKIQHEDVKIPKFNAVREWIAAYRDVLIAHYFNMINDRQALSLLLSIDKAKESKKILGEYLREVSQKR